MKLIVFAITSISNSIFADPLNKFPDLHLNKSKNWPTSNDFIHQDSICVKEIWEGKRSYIGTSNLYLKTTRNIFCYTSSCSQNYSSAFAGAASVVEVSVFVSEAGAAAFSLSVFAAEDVSGSASLPSDEVHNVRLSRKSCIISVESR